MRKFKKLQINEVLPLRDQILKILQEHNIIIYCDRNTLITNALIKIGMLLLEINQFKKIKTPIHLRLTRGVVSISLSEQLVQVSDSAYTTYVCDEDMSNDKESRYVQKFCDNLSKEYPSPGGSRWYYQANFYNRSESLKFKEISIRLTPVDKYQSIFIALFIILKFFYIEFDRHGIKQFSDRITGIPSEEALAKRIENIFEVIIYTAKVDEWDQKQRLVESINRINKYHLTLQLDEKQKYIKGVNENACMHLAAYKKARQDLETFSQEFNMLKKSYDNLYADNEMVSEIADFMLKSAIICDIEYLKDTVRFKTLAPATYIDIELYKCIKDNTFAVFGKHGVKLFDDIFINKKYNLMLSCNWELKPSGKISLDYRPLDDKTEGIPQPHMYYFNCLGSFEGQILEAEENGDYIGLLQLACTITQNINFSDLIVLDKFYGGIDGKFNSTPCIKDKDGNLFTFAEMLKKYKEELDANE